MASPNQNDQTKPQLIVVLVPFPVHGHLIQLLHVARLISAYNIAVHYVCTTTHNRQIKSRIHGWDPLSAANLHFHQLPTPPFASPPPNPNSDSKFPYHLQPLFDATLLLRQPMADLLRSLSTTTNKLVVIHDPMSTSLVQDLVTLPNAEAYNFQTVSAFYISSHVWEAMGRPPALQDETLQDLPSMAGCFPPEFMEFVRGQCNHNFDSGTLHDVCKLIEPKYFDLLIKMGYGGNKNQWAIGPLNPVTIKEDQTTSSERHKCLKWLDDQDLNSVIYVSFGTSTSLTDEQVHELAIGLENSEQKFIWVLRDADKGDIYDGDVRRSTLPNGYEARIEGKGIVVRDWAPQLEILGHPSTGGFMSHCGWNSCLESISMGVPMATWPMHSDQPRNAVLIAKVLKIGTVVNDWERRNHLVMAAAVERAIRILLTSEEGKEMRKRAAEMGGDVRRSVAEGGVSRVEMDSFISHITRN